MSNDCARRLETNEAKMAEEVPRSNQVEALDFLSDKFDPLRALYTHELQPPIPNIQVFNNLAEYARVIKEGKAKTPTPVPTRESLGPNRRAKNLKPEFKPPDISTRLAAIAQQQEVKENIVLGSGERSPFLSEERAEKTLQTEQRWKKKHKNLLERMEGNVNFHCVELIVSIIMHLVCILFNPPIPLSLPTLPPPSPCFPLPPSFVPPFLHLPFILCVAISPPPVSPLSFGREQI